MLPFVVDKTLGKEMGSVNLAWMWALLQTVPKDFRENAVRAGFQPGPAMGDDIFQAILDHPEGLWIGQCDPTHNFANIKTNDGRINLNVLFILARPYRYSSTSQSYSHDSNAFVL